MTVEVLWSHGNARDPRSPTLEIFEADFENLEF